MKRRTFLIGTGSAALGGSALLGSGAFSKVESQRSVTIQVAEDPNAYLGMDKCSLDGSETPNSSYAHLDGNGHLELLMNPDNPTIGNSSLGDGINSDSTTWFDNVFQICNQGKEDVCLWIEDDEDWPRVSEGEPDAGEREVDFYLGDDDFQSIVGEDNAILLPLGECVCVGLLTRSYDLSEGDEVLGDLDNEVTIVADVDGDCVVPPEEGQQRIYLTNSRDRDDNGDEVRIELVGTTPGISNYTYDPAQNYRVASLNRVSGNNEDEFRNDTAHHYTEESQAARQAIDDAQAAIDAAGGNDNAEELVGSAVSSYENGNFQNAEDLAGQAESQAQQAQQSAQTQRTLLLVGGGLVVLLLLVGGGYYAYTQMGEDDYSKL